MPIRVIFNTNKLVKQKAQKRAHKEGTDLTSILNQTLLLYGEGAYHPDDFLTKEDMRAIQRGLADVKAARVTRQEKVFRKLGL